MSFRKEKKFRLSYSDMMLVKQDLIKAGMDSLYQPRKVNSCYFDTKYLEMFSHSEEGVLPRKKVRVRWYDQTTSFVREEKTSSIEGRFKTTSPLLGLASDLSDVKHMQILDQSYGILTPVIIVSYQREYYSLSGMRITFDSCISYTDIRCTSAPTYRDSENVMEIKVPIDCSDDYIEGVIPYPTSRFSKYSRGLLMSNGMM